MTYEEMIDIAEKIADALREVPGINDVSVMKSDAKPGDPIPVGFTYPDSDGDAMDLIIELDMM